MAFGIIGILGLLIAPSTISPTAQVSAIWIDYGSYISTMSAVHVYNDEGVQLLTWTRSTSGNTFDIPIGEEIGNVSVSGILRSTELGTPADPKSSLVISVAFFEYGEFPTFITNYVYEYDVWLDSDDWYFILYFNNSSMDTWTIDEDVTYVLSVKMTLYLA